MSNDHLLIIHHGALGDVVITFPALLKLKRYYRFIDLICQPKIGRLARYLNVVDDWLSIDTAAMATLYSNSIAPYLKKILQKYDRIILFSYSSPVKENIEQVTKITVDLIYPRPEVDKTIHVADYILKSLSKLKLIQDTDVNLPQIPSAPLFPMNTVKNKPATILIHPGSGSLKKNWPLSNFLKTASYFAQKGFQTKFVLGPAEHHMNQPLKKAGIHKDRVYHIDDPVKFVEILTTASGFIGNDSGLSHLAAFLDIPTVVIFGPSDPLRWKPVGNKVAVVRAELDCTPCFETGMDHCNDIKCLNHTTPEMVIKALKSFALECCD